MKKILLIIFITLLASQVWATTYYIDPTCSNNGNGTTTDPTGATQVCAVGSGQPGPFNAWANVTWAAGNTYLQRYNTTTRETVSVGASGTSGSPITMGGYGTGSLHKQ